MTAEQIVTIEDVKTNALAVVTENELSSEEGTLLKNALIPFFEQAEEWVQKAKTLKVTDESQIEEMTNARTARLALKDIRVNLDKKRKELKEESLRKGKAIDGMANILKFLIEPIEEYLEKQEKFVEIREAERKAKLESERKEQLVALGVDTAFYDLKTMPEAQFQTLLIQAQETKRLKEKEAERLEEERKEKEKAEAEEREARRIENEKLKAENDAKEAELKKEREAKEKLEKEKKDREEKERKEKEKAEREAKQEEKRLAKLGDAGKIEIIIATLQGLKFPVVDSEEAQILVSKIQRSVEVMIGELKKF